MDKKDFTYGFLTSMTEIVLENNQSQKTYAALWIGELGH